MRLVISAALLCAAAVPAAAQSRDQAHVAARALQNPAVQEGLADVLGELAGIILDTRVGPIAHYADREDDIRPNDTLRSIVRRDDPDFEARMHDRTRQAVATAGVAANDALAMGDELSRTSARLRAAFAPLAALAGDYRDDY